MACTRTQNSYIKTLNSNIHLPDHPTHNLPASFTFSPHIPATSLPSLPSPSTTPYIQSQPSFYSNNMKTIALLFLAASLPFLEALPRTAKSAYVQDKRTVDVRVPTAVTVVVPGFDVPTRTARAVKALTKVTVVPGPSRPAGAAREVTPTSFA